MATGSGKPRGAGEADPVNQCLVALLTLATCAVFATQLGHIYVERTDAGLGARGLPQFVLVAGALLAVLQLAANLPRAVARLTGDVAIPDRNVTARVLLLLVIALAYVWAITLFQYALPTLVAMSGLLYLFGSRGPWRLVVLPVLTVAAYYVLFFVLLGVFENPGHILAYDSYTFAFRIRQMIGLQ